MTSMEDEKWVYWRMKAKMLEDENEELKEALKSKEKVIKAHENYLNTLNYLRLGD